MTNDWGVEPADLAAVAGVTYDQAVIDAAVRSVKNYLGWPVSPRLERTVIVDGPPTHKLALPTLDPDAFVMEVRDVTSDTPVVLTGWRKLNTPILFRSAGWPCGEASIEIDLRDGYTDLPPDLLPMIANACASQGSATGGTLKTVRVDDYSEEYDTSATAASGPTKSQPYRLPRRTTA